MLFAPEQTTVIGVEASTGRSADTSAEYPLWTPPIPPVAKTWIPQALAINEVVATVVAPSIPRAMATGRSRTESFLTDGSTNRSTSLSERPTLMSPSITAVIAGTAPRSRTAPIIRSAAFRLSG